MVKTNLMAKSAFALGATALALAVLPLILGIVGLGALYLGYERLSIDALMLTSLVVTCGAGVIVTFLFPLSLIFAILAIVGVSRSKGATRGTARALSGVALAVLSGGVILYLHIRWHG